MTTNLKVSSVRKAVPYLLGGFSVSPSTEQKRMNWTRDGKKMRVNAYKLADHVDFLAISRFRDL